MTTTVRKQDIDWFTDFKLQVKSTLEALAQRLPFPARVVNHEMLLAEERLEEEKKMKNMNPYTYEYLIKNNMLGCQRWIKLLDFKYFGKYPS